MRAATAEVDPVLIQLLVEVEREFGHWQVYVLRSVSKDEPTPFTWYAIGPFLHALKEAYRGVGDELAGYASHADTASRPRAERLPPKTKDPS